MFNSPTPFQKIGFIDFENMTPLVSNLGKVLNGEPGFSMANELYQNENTFILTFRSTCKQSQQKKFLEEVKTLLCSTFSKASKLIFISSISDEITNDHEQGRSTVYCTSGSQKSIDDLIKNFGFVDLKARIKDQDDTFASVMGGAGISKKVFSEKKKDEFPLEIKEKVIGLFVIAGGGIDFDATFHMLKVIGSILKLSFLENSNGLKIPSCWEIA